MKSRITIIFLSISSIFILAQCKKDVRNVPGLTKEEVGKLIFFDNTLSNPVGQSCASCHGAEAAFTDPTHSIVSAGIVDGLFGNRNAPSVSYAMFSPSRYYDPINETYVGGQFWDGRVNTLEEQAKKPFFNPLEMNIDHLPMFMQKVKNATYYQSFVDLYGASDDAETILNNVADAIAAFEKSPEVNPFSSKFDYYLKGEVSLTQLEKAGMLLFQDTAKGKCANCHIITPEAVSGKILFTDFTYDNIGVPKNKFNPYYEMPAQFNIEGSNYLDSGLSNSTLSQAHKGQFKVPTLRNVAITAPYFHNGVFGTLEEVVHFYNKRDMDPTIGAPEINENVNIEELGNLMLTAQEEKAIVAFLKTLTDGY